MFKELEETDLKERTQGTMVCRNSCITAGCVNKQLFADKFDLSSSAYQLKRWKYLQPLQLIRSLYHFMEKKLRFLYKPQEMNTSWSFHRAQWRKSDGDQAEQVQKRLRGECNHMPVKHTQSSHNTTTAAKINIHLYPLPIFPPVLPFLLHIF